ncbi:MAG: helix-turn-helix transcriptional regulator [Candidatus Aminicenantes bacterium]|nr:helix-turn-helix transcriptional regulator [Candidatus Aminicenantes bacterium]
MKLLTRQEELILLAIFQIRDDSCLLNIRDVLVKNTGKDWAFASLYLSLENLRKKGLVRTRRGKPSAVRGGKAVKYYEITKQGFTTLFETKKIQDRMWLGLSESTAKTEKK